jgi:hypothetical protein
MGLLFALFYGCHLTRWPIEKMAHVLRKRKRNREAVKSGKLTPHYSLWM